MDIHSNFHTTDSLSNEPLYITISITLITNFQAVVGSRLGVSQAQKAKESGDERLAAIRASWRMPPTYLPFFSN